MWPPCSAISASLEPMKMCKSSFGDAIAFASAKVKGSTEGIVAIAPLVIEKGNGHNLIMTRSFRPSCFTVRERAAKRESFAVKRSAVFRNKVLETTKAAVAPEIEAVAATNHLYND